MKFVSWNCRGMGSKEKKEDLGKLIHIQKAFNPPDPGDQSKGI
jgi:hypothetical protein